MPSQERVPECEQRADHVVFGSRKHGSSKPMRTASARKTSTFERASPGGGQRGARQLHVVMAVREVEVGVLQERGGGQQDVGVVGGVGLELLQHHGEQVLAAQAREHHVLVGRDGRGIGVVDHQRLARADRRVR